MFHCACANFPIRMVTMTLFFYFLLLSTRSSKQKETAKEEKCRRPSSFQFFRSQCRSTWKNNVTKPNNAQINNSARVRGVGHYRKSHSCCRCVDHGWFVASCGAGLPSNGSDLRGYAWGFQVSSFCSSCSSCSSCSVFSVFSVFSIHPNNFVPFKVQITWLQYFYFFP